MGRAMKLHFFAVNQRKCSMVITNANSVINESSKQPPFFKDRRNNSIYIKTMRDLVSKQTVSCVDGKAKQNEYLSRNNVALQVKKR